MTEKAIQTIGVLAKIADAYDANDLDDEARKRWGENLEFENQSSPSQIVLYSGRGGKTLLTLQDCLDAREALRSMAAVGAQV